MIDIIIQYFHEVVIKMGDPSLLIQLGVLTIALLTAIIVIYKADHPSDSFPKNLEESNQMAIQCGHDRRAFEELKQELEKNSYFEQDVKDWWKFRGDELKKLPYDQYKQLLSSARLSIECDRMCI